MKISILILKKALSLFIILFLVSCNKDEPIIFLDPDFPVFTKVSSKETQINFINKSFENPERNITDYDYFYNGSGVAIGDLNNDGNADIFFAGNDTQNKLYLNEGNFNFRDISKEAGFNTNKWATGVSLIDINNDGWLDVYICNSGPNLSDDDLANELYINNKDMTFTESAAQYGIADTSFSTQAVFFDMDKDGDLDLFVMNHSLIRYGNGVVDWEKKFNELDENIQKKSINTLYRNNGNKQFTDITREAGLYRPGFGLGVAVSDFDENGLLDIYVANDYFVPDFLYFNVGNNKFVENIKARASHSSYFSMGCDAADFNNDGLIDLTVVDMTPSDHYRSKTLMESMNVGKFNYLVQKKGYLPQYMFNSLNLNRGKGNFSEIGQQSGMAQTEWSWAALLADLNNDSWKDILITNGFKRDTKDRDWMNKLQEAYSNEKNTQEDIFDVILEAKSNPTVNFIYKNKGNLNFEDTSTKWGFTEPSFSQGAAYGDLDNDGDLDVVINNLESEAYVYRNNSSQKENKHYIQFVLSDVKNPASVMHSKVRLYTGEQYQIVEYSFVRGYLSTMQPLAHFGLGAIDKIDKVEISWPDGTISTITNPEVDKLHRIERNEIASTIPNTEKGNLHFIDIAQRVGLADCQHIENDFDDFKTEILLPHKQSSLGPGLAVGDVNGDGIEDFYMGGAKDQPGQMYLQNLKNGFVVSSQNAFLQDAKFEDLGALFFDADSDGDLDLYVASGGGGDVKNSSSLLQDRLYLNNGKGDFSKSYTALPKIESSTAVIKAHDWDNDGDPDLFVGGRTTPGKYPLAPESYLLRNENGKFKNVTKELAPKLKNVGMITDSCWSDIDQDGDKDLIIVGEWMPITIFINTSEGFADHTENYGLNDETGWWYSIDSGDFDNDGDEDFIVGNIGLNNKFHPSKEKPLHIFSSDFDNNGTLDIVLSKEYKGSLAPVRGKECSTDQMPFISEKFPMFSDFASSTLEDIYGAEKLQEALHYKATNFASMFMENKGNGSFEFRELPPEAQLSPINDMIVWDFDKDGNLDLVIGGNMFHSEVETPAYDAGKGLFLKGRGDGTFLTSSKIEESGIFIPNDAKQLSFISLFQEKRPAILVANNNSGLNLFLWRQNP